MKKNITVLLCAGALSALTFTIVQSRYPDWRTFSNQPPQLNPVTAQAQNGFELLGIEKTEREAYTLVINAPNIPKTTSIRSAPYSPSNEFRIKAVTSSGQSWKVGWRVDSSQSSFHNGYDIPLRSKSYPDPKVLAELPMAYPPGNQWVDVEITDRRGSRANWRINNLQTAKNTVPSPSSQSNTYTRDGVFLRLDGQWRHWDSQSHQEWRGELSLLGCVEPRPFRKWKVEPSGANLQWISYRERSGPIPTGQRFGQFLSTLKPINNANLTSVKSLFANELIGYNPTSNKYGTMYFDLLEYEVDKSGKETLLSRTPISLTAPFIDKGSQEKLYPQVFKRKATSSPGEVMANPTKGRPTKSHS